MSEQNKTLVRRFFDEVCNGRKLAVADELFSTSHVYHDPSSPWVGPGPDGMKQLIGLYQRSFPDAHWTIDQIMDSGDMVVTRWTGRGTNDAELMGIPATKKKAVVPGIWIHRVAGGKIVESWNVWDTLGMFQQLGVVPPLGQVTGQSAS